MDSTSCASIGFWRTLRRLEILASQYTGVKSVYAGSLGPEYLFRAILAMSRSMNVFVSLIEVRSSLWASIAVIMLKSLGNVLKGLRCFILEVLLFV